MIYGQQLITQGFKKGLQEGELKGKIEIACKLLDKGLSLKEVSDLTEFSVTKLEKLRKKKVIK